LELSDVGAAEDHPVPNCDGAAEDHPVPNCDDRGLLDPALSAGDDRDRHDDDRGLLDPALD